MRNHHLSQNALSHTHARLKQPPTPMAGTIVLVHMNVRGLTMRGSDAGASRTWVAERSRSLGGATCAEAIVTDPTLPEQTDAYLSDRVIIRLSRKEIHKPMVLI